MARRESASTGIFMCRGPDAAVTGLAFALQLEEMARQPFAYDTAHVRATLRLGRDLERILMHGGNANADAAVTRLKRHLKSVDAMMKGGRFPPPTEGE